MSKITPTLTGVLKSPIDYLYIFASDEFLAALSPKRAKLISAKKANQKGFLNVSAKNAGSDYDTWYYAIKNKIVELYGIEPREVLHQLALGKTIAGKNWSKGVYGIGTVSQQSFDQAPAVSVSSTTGKIMQNGQELSGQTPIYGSDGNVVGYSAITGAGLQFQSALDTMGRFFANTYSDSTGVAQYANGNAYDASRAHNAWETVLTMLPYLSSLIQYIVSLFGGQAYTPRNTAASQSDWIEPASDKSSLLLFAGGAALLYAISEK